MTYANQLTVLRMAFVPLVVLLIVYDYSGYALLVFLAAGITDMLDGLIARRFGQRTAVGTVLDPIADKLLLVSSFITLSVPSLGLTVTLPLWLTITAISRDFLLVVSVLVINLMVGRRVYHPSLLGKLTTASQLLLVLTVLFSNYIGSIPTFLKPLIYATLALTVASGLHYMMRGMFLLEHERRASD